MSSAIEALRHFFAAINRNEMEAVTRHFDPDIVRTEPADFPSGGTYRGSAQIHEHLRRGRDREYHSFGERADALKWAGIEA